MLKRESFRRWDFSKALVPLTGHLVYHLWYEWIHLAHHSKDYKPLTSVGKNLRDAHMSHHFHNENFNWGITNMIGDYFFGSLKDNKSVQKSPTTKSISGYIDSLSYTHLTLPTIYSV